LNIHEAQAAPFVALVDEEGVGGTSGQTARLRSLQRMSPLEPGSGPRNGFSSPDAVYPFRVVTGGAAAVNFDPGVIADPLVSDLTFFECRVFQFRVF